MNNLLLSLIKTRMTAYLSAGIYKHVSVALMLSGTVLLSACGGGGGAGAGTGTGASSVVIVTKSDIAVPSSSVVATVSSANNTISSNASSISPTASSVVGNVSSAAANSVAKSSAVTSSAIVVANSKSSVATSSIAGASSVKTTSSTITTSASSVKATSSTSTTAQSSVAGVLTGIEIAPGAVSLAVNASQQLVAVGKMDNGSLSNLYGKVTWRISSGAAFASVTATGLLKRTAAGAVEVEATAQDKTAVLKLATASQNLTLSYDNTKTKWTKVNIHLWNDAGTTVWPGNAMKDNGDGTWSYEVDASKLVSGSIKAIFNNGAGSQTDDAHALVSESATYSDGVWIPTTTGGGTSTTADVSVIAGSITGGGSKFASGTVLTVTASDSTVAFSGWGGASAAYIFSDPYKSTAQLVVPSNVSSVVVQALFAAAADPFKSARNLYASQCVSCHGINGVGGPNPALNALGSKYTLATLTTKIATTMPMGGVGSCVGTTAGTCAYDIANMIVSNKWVSADTCTGTNCNASDSLDSQNLRLLTTEEYLNSVRDIFAINFDASVMTSAIGDGTNRNYNTASSLALDYDRTVGYQMAAAEIAKQVIANKSFFSVVSGCNSDKTCVVTALGKKVFRRPLTSAEVSRYVDLYTDTDAGKAVIQGMLISPYFMYRSEMGTETSPGSGLYRLNNYEIATLLSYSFWASTPDDTLLAAAASTLDIKAQVTRMLADSKADRGFRRFAQGWLLNSKYGYSAISDPTLAAALDEETIRFAIETIKANAPYKNLLTANYTYANADVAKYYGSSAVASGWGISTFADSDPRSGTGILGHGSFLATRVSSIDNPSPIKRGTFVRDVLMCQELPPPQKAGLAIPKGPTDSNRKATFNHTNSEACQGCHQFIDGIGFGLENYGSNALYRATETLGNGVAQAIDASGSIKSLNSAETTLDPNSASIEYQSVPQLANLIANSGQGSACYSRQFYRYIIGRNEGTADEKIIPVYSANLRAGGGMKDMLVSLAVNPSFILRRK